MVNAAQTQHQAEGFGGCKGDARGDALAKVGQGSSIDGFN